MERFEIREKGVSLDASPKEIPAIHTWDPNSKAGYPLFLVMEKGVPFDHVFYDLLKFEEGLPEFLAVNPKGMIPALEHRGRTFTDPIFMCEYLDAVLPGPNFTPDDPALRYEMRYRSRRSDDISHSISANGWNNFIKPALAGKSREEVEELILRNPTRQRQIAWRKAIIEGFADEELAAARTTIRNYVFELNALLEGRSWLVGEQFTIADMVTFANFYATFKSLPDTVPQDQVPFFMGWVKRCYARPRMLKTFELAQAVGTRAFALASELGIETGAAQ